ncbi:related to methyltransferase [Cephalotrichum gorgonifer]|uniref:Related to methyltransferase n=1 Tax=Cephalotrichum gorgonifer TaxID=2041049 RepID=A0AAE8N7Z6_9PEZI|nr:related to methyltransferase [Cephalotrichum gorgonifer]
MAETRPYHPAAADEHPNGGALVADDFDDADSALSAPEQSLQSLRSSVLEFQQENGVSFPEFGDTHSRMMILKSSVLRFNPNMWLLTLRGELALCPKVHGANRVLDVGTGSGLWAIDYADLHPDAEVTGVDLSPIQPSLVPPNCFFEVDDVEKEWTWTKSFDFIMSRVMAGSLADYESYIQKAYDALEPGGYLELQDLHFPHGCDDGTMTEETAIYRLGHLFLEASIALGRPLNPAPTYKGIMEKVGFEDVVQQKLVWLLGTGLGWTKEEVLVFCTSVRAELKSSAIHGYLPIYVVYGKKPEAPVASPSDAPANASAGAPTTA